MNDAISILLAFVGSLTFVVLVLKVSIRLAGEIKINGGFIGRRKRKN